MNVEDNKIDNQSNDKIIIDNLYANREIRIYEDYCPTLRSERFGLLVAEIIYND